MTRRLLPIICICCFALPLTAAESVVRGWLEWRGPQQDGTSAETGLPDKVDSAAPLWAIDCGTGDGSVVCVNARTGDPIWRYQISAGGVNATLLPIDGALVAGHADENLDSSVIGRTVAVKTGAEKQLGSKEPAILDQTSELWRNKSY